MKFLILFACALAVASAGYADYGYHGYHGPQHLPIINHEGVPVDTADVQVARAAHLSHQVNVHHRNGDHALLGHHALGHSPVFAHAAPILAHSAYAHPILGHHGLHYRKRRGIYAGAPLAIHHGYHGYHGPQHLPIINHEGVPVDTADVQVARAAHLSHRVNVHHRNGGHAAYVHGPIVAHGYGHHY